MAQNNLYFNLSMKVLPFASKGKKKLLELMMSRDKSQFNGIVARNGTRAFGTHSLTSEEEINKEQHANNQQSQTNTRENQEKLMREQYFRKYAVLGKDLKNVAVNFSMIKHNEFKGTISQQNGVNIGVEELDFSVVQNLGRSQD